MATDRVKIQDPSSELAQAQSMVARYRCEYVDLREGSIDHELFRSIPVDLMFRYNFVPLHAQNGSLDIALADPRNLGMIDELAPQSIISLILEQRSHHGSITLENA